MKPASRPPMTATPDPHDGTSPITDCEKAAAVVSRRRAWVIALAAVTATLTGGAGLLVGTLTLLGVMDEGDPASHEVAALFLLLSAPTVVIFWHLQGRTPDLLRDDLDEWHKALDHAVGVLLVIPGMFVGGLILDELAPAVFGPLIALSTIGALYATLTAFRPAFHSATQQKYRRVPPFGALKDPPLRGRAKRDAS